MKILIFVMCFLFFPVFTLYAGEIVAPAGTRIDGTTMFGTFAPSETASAPTFSLSIKAVHNPVGADGKEIPLKDCIIMGDVVGDITVNRAFFKANRIVCSNAKEAGGSPIKGYLVDERDNKLGIQGVPQASATTASGTPQTQAGGPAQRFVEVPGGIKVTFYTLEGVVINTK